MTVSYINFNYASYLETTINEPGGSLAGNLLLLYVTISETTVGTIPTPSGFTFAARLTGNTGGTDGVVLCIFWRIRGASAVSANITPTGGGSYQTAVMESFRDVDQTNPLQVITTTYTGQPRTFSPSSLSVFRPGSMLVSGSFAWNAAPTAMAGGGTWTIRGTAGSIPELATFTAPVAAAGATGTISVSGGETVHNSVVGWAAVVQPPDTVIPYDTNFFGAEC